MQRLLPLPLKVTANSQTYRWKWAVTPTVRVLCNGAQENSEKLGNVFRDVIQGIHLTLADDVS